MTKKMTKKEMFKQMLTHLTDPAEIAFVEHEIAQLEKRKNVAPKLTPNQIANIGIREAMLTAMEPGVQYTITQISKLVPELNEAANQKINALLIPMVQDGIVIKEYVNRKPMFSKA